MTSMTKNTPLQAGGYSRIRKPPFLPESGESGVALLAVIFALLLITLVGMAIAFTGILEVQGSNNYQHSVESFYLADAGINHAFKEIETHHIAFNDLLVGADATADTADDGYLLHSSIPESERISATGFTFGAGLYQISIVDDVEADNNLKVDTNQRVLLTSVATGRDGATTTLQAIVSLGGGIPAIVSKEDLKISGNATIDGRYGGVHANGDLLVSGSPSIAKDATATGTYTETGSPVIGGIGAGGQPELEIPTINAESHRTKADYVLGEDGMVRDPSGTVLADCSDGNTAYRGWKFTTASPVEWTSNTSKNDYFPGTYFVEGSASITGHIGDTGVVVPITIIAKGNIRASGSAETRPDSGDIFMLADGDIQISGDIDDGDQNFTGFIATHEQLQITGTPNLFGHIIIENGPDIHDLVHENDISGNMHITANGAFTSIGPTGTPMLISWREIRN